jgi:hypothetical protein
MSHPAGTLDGMRKHSRTSAVGMWGVTVALAAVSVTASPAPRIIRPAGGESFTVPECIAHRGNVDNPSHTEETTGAYEDSAPIAETVEGDMRWSSSGYPAMLHDADLGVFGAPTKKLANLTLTQAGSYESPTHDTIASLYAVRQVLVKYPNVGFQLEMKEDVPDWEMLASRLDPIKSRVTLSSFSLTRVRDAQDHGYRTLYLTATDTGSTAAPTVAEDASAVDAGTVEALSKVGVNVQAYSPDTPALWDSLAAAGVTAMITNKPEACMAHEWKAN